MDLNADLGEGVENEPLLMPWLTSCNIACGGHVGDEASMSESIALAHAHNLHIGVHPSYPDHEYFGRRVLDIEPVRLMQSLIQQITSFIEVLNRMNGQLHHLKPHGALYNEAARSPKLAQLILDVMKALNLENVILYTLPGSLLSSMAAEQGVHVWREGFADRNYNDDLTLVNRRMPQAMVGANEVVKHVGEMISNRSIRTVQGNLVPCDLDTICVHGDNPEALNILKSIKPLIQK